MTNIYGKEKLFPSQKFGLKNSFILCRKKVNMLILHEIWKFNERKIDPNKLKNISLLTKDKNKETVFHLVANIFGAESLNSRENNLTLDD